MDITSGVLTTIALDLGNSIERMKLEIADLAGHQARISALVKSEAWSFPVGSDRFPIANWYCAQFFTFDKQTNPGGHTGLDLNGDKPPYGDIDRDEPTFAVAPGIVHSMGYSEGWRGVVVLQVIYNNAPLWVRYGHLDYDSISVAPGQAVVSGQHIGNLGNYKRGDHLHTDFALDPFWWSHYRTWNVRWIDPLPVLIEKLDPALVQEMVDRA